MGSKEKMISLSKQHVSTVYALIDRFAPYPCDAMERHVPLQYKLCHTKAKATSVHVPVTKEGFADVVCGLCWATTYASCPCGALLVASVDLDKYNDFWNFYSSSCNPLLHPWDPEDQRSIFQGLASQLAVTTGLEAEGMIRGLLALCIRSLGFRLVHFVKPSSPDGVAVVWQLLSFFQKSHHSGTSGPVLVFVQTQK